MPNELLLTEPRSIAVRPYDEEPLAAGEVRAEAIVSGISHGTELALYRGVVAVRRQALRYRPSRVRRRRRARGVPDAARLRVGRDGDRARRRGRHAARSATSSTSRCRTARRRRSRSTISASRSRRCLPISIPSAPRCSQSATIALQAIHDARLKVGDTVAVFGLGVFGLLAVQLARLSGARWIAGVDPIEGRRELAGRLGADAVARSSGGRRRTRDQAGRRARRRRRGDRVLGTLLGTARRRCAASRLAGTVVAAGFYTGGAGDELRLGEEWHHNRLTLVSSMSGWGAPHREAGWDRPRLRATVLDLIASGRLEVDALVTHRIPFAQAAEAYDLIDREPETTLRVLLEYRARA